MDKRDLKRVVLGQLATRMRMEVLVDGITEEGDLARAEQAQLELAVEFERRCNGATYDPRWDKQTTEKRPRPHDKENRAITDEISPLDLGLDASHAFNARSDPKAAADCRRC